MEANPKEITLDLSAKFWNNIPYRGIMDKKVLLAVALLTAAVLFGGVFLLSNSSGPSKVEQTLGAQLETSQKEFDFEDIKYDGGKMSHAFPIKNDGSKDLVLANLSTSCMCTQVYFEKSGVKSPTFGMKGHASASDYQGILKPGEEGQIVAVFDPTAHGPQGIGPVSRLVSLETNDPDNPYVEFGFSGTVVK